MPPPVALTLTLGLIAYLLWRDAKELPRVSKAIWIPILWLMINGSRQVGQWFDAGTALTAQRLEEGTPIDKAVYASLILAGLWVLARRRVNVGQVLRSNPWIIVFILYEGMSVMWSDFPLVSFKRWIKAVGDPVMILVVWTDPVPARAIVASLKRCAYVLIPLSVLFCKYYEHLGRRFSAWGGSSYTGVTTDKNMLGYLLFAFGVFFAAALLVDSGRRLANGSRDRASQLISVLLLTMIAWLVVIANSQTALVSLLIGITVLLASRVRMVRRHVGSFAIAMVVVIVAAEFLFAVSESLVEATGRDMTFTGRTGLWQTVLREPVNPLFGAGYSSFWLGERLTRFWAMYPNSPPMQAHNAYVELYVNLGLVGLFLLAGVLWTGLRRVRQRVAALDTTTSDHDRLIGLFGLSYGVAFLFYSITEATFAGLNTLFVIFLMLAFQYQRAPTLQHTFAVTRASGGWKPRGSPATAQPAWQRR
jgi:exopolysaccharide production protein ExoQ